MLGLKIGSRNLPQGAVLIVRLNLRVARPDARLDFLRPLDLALGSRGLGKVACRAPEIDAEGGHVIRLELAAITPAVLDIVTDVLDRLCAPRGSVLADAEGNVLRHFGSGETLALLFDDPPLAGDPADDPLADIARAVGGPLCFQGPLAREPGTALCFLVPSAARAADALRPILARHPACANARLARVA